MDLSKIRSFIHNFWDRKCNEECSNCVFHKKIEIQNDYKETLCNIFRNCFWSERTNGKLEAYTNEQLINEVRRRLKSN
ncbi:hypothetical protein [Clostridium sp. Marseille-Q7071]